MSFHVIWGRVVDLDAEKDHLWPTLDFLECEQKPWSKRLIPSFASLAMESLHDPYRQYLSLSAFKGDLTGPRMFEASTHRCSVEALRPQQRCPKLHCQGKQIQENLQEITLALPKLQIALHFEI